MGYRVGSNVTSHTCHGCGVYHYFRDYPVTVETGIAAPASASFNSKKTRAREEHSPVLVVRE